jgi:Cu/Ag efflux pump CusA
MLAWIISSSLRLRDLIVVVAVGVLIFGAVSLKDKSLDVIPEFLPLSLTIKTESLGLSSAEVESLITVPLEADLLNGVPWLQVIQSESMAGLSTIEMIFAPGTDLMKARQMVQERLTQTRALPNVSSPPTMLQRGRAWPSDGQLADRRHRPGCDLVVVHHGRTGVRGGRGLAQYDGHRRHADGRWRDRA